MSSEHTREQIELFRIAGQSILAQHRAGRKFSPDALADARKWAAYPPLPHALSAGSIPDNELPPALRGGALEVF